jgi:hypothetical protein
MQTPRMLEGTELEELNKKGVSHSPAEFKFCVGGKLNFGGKSWVVRKITKKDIVLREIKKESE